VDTVKLTDLASCGGGLHHGDDAEAVEHGTVVHVAVGQDRPCAALQEPGAVVVDPLMRDRDARCRAAGLEPRYAFGEDPWT